MRILATGPIIYQRGGAMDDFIAVFATSPSADEADRIARALVEGGAAPCVNVVPGIVSIYAWKGEVSRDGEWLMIIKSRRDRFPLVREIVEANHSYEVPEVIAVSLAEVSPKYRAYLEDFFGDSA
jgi:periplasmic divalent cation tolerance protein